MDTERDADDVLPAQRAHQLVVELAAVFADLSVWEVSRLGLLQVAVHVDEWTARLR